MTTELQSVIDRIKAYTWYPPDIQPLTGDSDDTLFFPAGPGMYDPEEGNLSGKPIMIVGYRYTPHLNVLKTHGIRGDRLRTTPAWNALLFLLIRGDIDPLDCFFTNYLLGVRRGKMAKNRLPDAKFRMSDHYFREHCRDIFRFTLELQRPRVIVVLGLNAASLLARLHPMLAVWQNSRSYKDLDEEYRAILRDIPLVAPHRTTLVLLSDPVSRKTHIQSRKNGRCSGDTAEIRLLRTVGSVLRRG